MTPSGGRKATRGHRQGREHRRSPSIPELFKRVVVEGDAVARARRGRAPTRAPAWRCATRTTTSCASAAEELHRPLGSPGHRRPGRDESEEKVEAQGDGQTDETKAQQDAERHRGVKARNRIDLQLRRHQDWLPRCRSRSGPGPRRGHQAGRRSTTATAGSREGRLFCERIFVLPGLAGYCGKYKRVRYKGIVSRALRVIVSRPRAPRSAVSGWATRTWRRRASTSGSSRACRRASATCSTWLPRSSTSKKVLDLRRSSSPGSTTRPARGPLLTRDRGPEADRRLRGRARVGARAARTARPPGGVPRSASSRASPRTTCCGRTPSTCTSR